MAQVLVGCKLPNGIIIEHPQDPEKKVTLNGLNKVVIIGADHAATAVDGDFWDAWLAANKEFSALVSGAIFVAKDARSLADAAKENAGRETGFEPMKKDGKDKRASGVKTEKGE